MILVLVNPFDHLMSIVLQTFNQDYKDRLSNISNLVLVKFLEDTMVQPKESEVSRTNERVKSGRVRVKLANQ